MKVDFVKHVTKLRPSTSRLIYPNLDVCLDKSQELESMEILTFNTDVERRVWLTVMRLLPCLFDSSTGIYAWIPVSHLGFSVVVVCIPILKWIVENVPIGLYSCKNDNVDIRKMLEAQFKPYGGVVNVDKRGTQFCDMILQTPFRVKDAEFFVVTSDSWKRFIAISVDGGCQEMFECNGGQETSLRRYGEVYSVQKGKSKLGCFKGYTVNAGKKKTIPAWGVPMWEELFTTPIKEYFGMVGEVGHVRGNQVRVCDKRVLKFSEAV